MNARQKIYWDENYLKEQLEAGKNYSDIANANRAGISTAQTVLHHYRLTKPRIPWTNQEISDLKKCYGRARDFKKYFPRRKFRFDKHLEKRRNNA